MERRSVVILLLIILIIGSLVYVFKFQSPGSEELSFSSKEENYLLDLAYNSIKLSINEDKRFVELNPLTNLHKYNNEVIINLKLNDNLIKSYISENENLIENVITASVRASKDNKFNKLIKIDGLKDLEIRIYILKNQSIIIDKSIEHIKEEIKLGEDGIKLRVLDGKEAYYSPHIPSLYKLNHEETLGNLCLKIKKKYPILKRFDENCWKDEAFEIYKLEMIKFEKEFSP